MLVATDLDGTIDTPVSSDIPAPTLCISGRTFGEYNSKAIEVAKRMPLYIRGVGKYGDREHAGRFKSEMINMLGVTHYLEDDPLQADIIRKNCPNVEVIMV